MKKIIRIIVNTIILFVCVICIMFFYSSQNIKSLSSVYERKYYANIEIENLPTKYSLKDALAKKGIALEAKSQLGGTCYSYAQTTMLETNMAMQNKKVPNFSEIHLVIGSSQG